MIRQHKLGQGKFQRSALPQSSPVPNVSWTLYLRSIAIRNNIHQVLEMLESRRRLDRTRRSCFAIHPILAVAQNGISSDKSPRVYASWGNRWLYPSALGGIYWAKPRIHGILRSLGLAQK